MIIHIRNGDCPSLVDSDCTFDAFRWSNGVGNCEPIMDDMPGGSCHHWTLVPCHACYRKQKTSCWFWLVTFTRNFPVEWLVVTDNSEGQNPYSCPWPSELRAEILLGGLYQVLLAILLHHRPYFRNCSKMTMTI